MSEEESSQFELQYSPGKGKWWVKVWPDMSGGIAVTNGIAVFIGEKASKKREHFYDSWPLESRLFAVRAPNPPLDITDEVLWRWSQESGGVSEKILSKAYISGIDRTNNALNLRFGVWLAPDWPSITVRRDWNQIADVMREVKEKGVVRKDLRWGTIYIEKEFKPETTNK
jgi:hypothetical protein